MTTNALVDDSIDVRIGQMIMTGFAGLYLTGSMAVREDVRTRHAGSVVLFEFDVVNNRPLYNVESPEQVRSLTSALQAEAAIPLLVTIDQEGGKVNRLKESRGFAKSLSAAELGAKNDPGLTRQLALGTAETLASIGINMNLAPDVDLCLNPENPIIAGKERSYSARPEVVIAHATEVIRAHHEKGILCTIKHFPGHGSSAHDSHLGFVDVTSLWSEVEIEPYRALIDAGLCDAVMTAHIFNGRIDPDYPATLSRKTITGILRDRLGFNGVVISDDMQMGAIAKEYGLETAIQKAIEAGIDIIAFGNNLVRDAQIVSKAIAIIKGLLLAHTVTEERIDESFQRIMKLKARIGKVS